MPKQDDGLRDQFNRLEVKHERQSDEIREASTNVALLKQQVDGCAAEIKELKNGVNTVREWVAEQTSASRTVTWKQLAGVVSVLVFVTTPLVTLAMSLWSTSSLTNRIVAEVKSDGMKPYFLTMINTGLDDRLKPTNTSLSTIMENTNSIKQQLAALKSAVKTTVTRKGVAGQLKHHTEGAAPSIRKNLPDVQDLLEAVEAMRVPLERQDYQSLSSRLYSLYATTTDPQMKKEFLATFIKAANAKSVSEPALHNVAESEFARARNSNNYFEGTIDLSSRPEWKDAIFNKCAIIISKPDTPLVLANVRFLECGFDSITESAAVRDFLSVYLETTRSTVSFSGSRVLMSYAIGKVRTKH
jgi:archaellum component FlaC